MKNFLHNLADRKSLPLFIILVLMALTILCGGCQSPQERNGVSLIPQNTPTTRSAHYIPMGGISF